MLKLKRKVKRFKLKVLSPVHIGTGNTLGVWDFAIRGNTVFVLKQDNFFKFLEERNKIEKAIELLEEGKGKADDFLSDYIPNELIKYRIPLLTGREENVEKIYEGIRNPFSGKLYIPASELKGFIRTAVIYKYLKEHKSLISKIKADFKETERLIFGDSTKDIFKYLRIEDIYGDFKEGIIKVKTLLTKKRFSLYTEAVTEGTSDEFRINIEIRKLQGSEFIECECLKYIENWKECCYEFSKDLIEAELSFWMDIRNGSLERYLMNINDNFANDILKRIKDFKKKNNKILNDIIFQLENLNRVNTKNSPVIRLGKHTGYLSHTVSILLTDKYRKYNANKIIKELGIRYKNFKEHLFPLTRKVIHILTTQGLKAVTLGWCQLEEVQR